MSDSVFASAPIREFAGCRLDPLPARAFFERVLDRMTTGQKRRPLLIGAHNLYSLYLYHHDATMAEFYGHCDDCYIDGQAVLWLLRISGCDTRNAHRFSLMDCLPQLLHLACERALRVTYIGGAREAVDRGRDWVAETWPNLAMRLHHGFFEDDSAMVDAINEFEPDLLIVGMGMPKQEAWIVDHRSSLRVGAIFQAGGTLDYYTGLQARPPGRLSRLGLAWLYRLVHDPRRLWRRYLITPWSLLGPAYRLRRSLSAGRGE